MKDMTSAYQAAEALMPWNTEHAVLNGAPEITWIDGDSFFYGRQYRKGEEVLTEFVRVSCTDGHEAPLFDHLEVALALGCEDIPFSSCRFDEKKLCLTFFYQGKEYDYHIDDRTLTDKGYPNAFGSSISPDQTKEVFSRDHDLYLRDRSTNKVTRPVSYTHLRAHET